jgi:phosphate transport system substrate-binding protein
MKRFILNSVAFFFILSLAISAHAKSQIIWMGCGITEKAFMGKIAEKFTQKTGITFRKAGGGATKGIRLTSSGKSHIGGTCRHLLVDKKNNVIPEEANVNLIHVAWDALVLITHKSNPLSGLTSQQVKDIYSGKIKNWKELGGKNEEIKLLVREGKLSGVGHMFRLLILGDKDFNFPISALKFESSGPLEKNIAGRFTNGIGVTGVSSAKKKVKILEIDGAFPTKENIITGKYPFFRPLYMAISKKPDENTKRLADYILSKEGQTIISNEGTVNLQEGKFLLSKWHLTKLK